MKNTLIRYFRKFFTLSLVTVGVFFIFPMVASAATLYDTSNDTSDSGLIYGVQLYSWTGSDYSTVPDWTISTLYAPYARTGGSGSLFIDAVILGAGSSFDYANALVTSGDVQEVSSGDSSEHTHTWSFSGSPNLRTLAEDSGLSSGTIGIGLCRSSGYSSWGARQQTSDTVDGYYQTQSGGNTAYELTATISGFEPLPAGTVSEITSITYPSPPSQYGVATSTLMEFEYTSATPTVAFAGIERKQLSPSGMSYIPTLATTTQSGYLTFSETVVWTDGSVNFWRAVLYDASYNVIDATQWYTLQVGTPSEFTPAETVSEDFFDNADASSTPSLFLSAFTNSIASFPPFSYFYQIRDAIDEQAGALADGSSLPTTSIAIGNASSTLYFSMDILDADELQNITGSDGWDSLRDLIAVALWLMLAWAMWESIISKFHRIWSA